MSIVTQTYSGTQQIVTSAPIHATSASPLWIACTTGWGEINVLRNSTVLFEVFLNEVKIRILKRCQFFKKAEL